MVSDDPIVLLPGARTAVGRFGKAFREIPAHELGAAAVVEALRRSGVDPNSVDEVVMGCVGQIGPDAYNARRVAVAAGLPVSTPALTVNRLCGSGLQAVWTTAQQLRWGGADVVVAGGDENMSRLPYLDYTGRDGDTAQPGLGDRRLLDGTLTMLTDPFIGQPMGITAERVAQRYQVSREEQDEYAAESQRRAATPQAAAAFSDEIVPVSVPGSPEPVTRDEHPRPGTTVEKLAGLPAAFAEGGSVTAGNAAGINDGAAALVLTRQSTADRLGLHPLAELVAVTTAAIEPEYMGFAPALALRKLFHLTSTSPRDVDVVELNEAFAAQVVAVMRDAGLDPDRTNPHGGAIALGHPVGATGAILTIRAMYDLVRRDLETAVVTLCIGGGQALAAMIRRRGS